MLVFYLCYVIIVVVGVFDSANVSFVFCEFGKRFIRFEYFIWYGVYIDVVIDVKFLKFF